MGRAASNLSDAIWMDKCDIYYSDVVWSDIDCQGLCFLLSNVCNYEKGGLDMVRWLLIST